MKIYENMCYLLPEIKSYGACHVVCKLAKKYTKGNVA